VIGIIPEALVAKEVAHAKLTSLRVVKTMHERKAAMHELADAFVALPGGFGTFEELFEIVTWAQLGIHRKAVALLDSGGYFAALIAMVDHAIEEDFVPEDQRALILSAESVPELIAKLANFRFPALRPKWVE